MTTEHFFTVEEQTSKPPGLFKIETLRTCPGCGWIMAGEEYMQAKMDLPCPRCREYCWSEFHVSRELVEWE